MDELGAAAGAAGAWPNGDADGAAAAPKALPENGVEVDCEVPNPELADGAVLPNEELPKDPPNGLVVEDPPPNAELVGAAAGAPKGDLVSPDAAGAPKGDLVSLDAEGAPKGDLVSPDAEGAPKGDLVSPDAAGAPKGDFELSPPPKPPKEDVFDAFTVVPEDVDAGETPPRGAPKGDLLSDPDGPTDADMLPKPNDDVVDDGGGAFSSSGLVVLYFLASLANISSSRPFAGKDTC